MSSLLLLLLTLPLSHPRLLVFVVVDFFLFDDDDRLIADPLGKEMVAAAGNRRGRLALLSAYEG